MDVGRLLTDRVRRIDASGIRRVFDLGARLKNPINLSIGQPDFDVPREVREAAIEAIESGRNGYTVTQGIALRERIARHLRQDVGWEVAQGPASATDARPGVIVTSGTSGALWLAMMALIGQGDEVIFGDPYFVLYPHLVEMLGGRAVRCDTYPDFRMTAERVAPLITDRTKAVLVNSPGNPTGTVLSGPECGSLLELCRSRGLLLISDEIYDEFTYADAREDVGCDSSAVEPGRRCPSPARIASADQDMLLIRGFGKTYGVTGWRLGYASGPRALIEEMAKLQQYTFVCAPSPLQDGAAAALDVDMSEYVATYRRRRDMVVDRLRVVTDLASPGAFYAFVKVPERLGLSGTQFVERCIDRSVLVIPGKVFSSRDSHFRLSYAVEDVVLERGLDVLVELLK